MDVTFIADARDEVSVRLDGGDEAIADDVERFLLLVVNGKDDEEVVAPSISSYKTNA